MSSPPPTTPTAKLCNICNIPGALLSTDDMRPARGESVWLSAAATRQAAVEFQQKFCPDAPLVTVRLLIMAYLSNNLRVHAFGSRCLLSFEAWRFLKGLLRTYSCHNAPGSHGIRALAGTLTTGFQTTLEVFSPVEIYSSFFDSILVPNDPRAHAKLSGTDTIVCYGTDTPASAEAIASAVGGITLGQNCFVASRREVSAHMAPLVSTIMHGTGVASCYLFAPVWTWLMLNGSEDALCLAEHVKTLATGSVSSNNGTGSSSGDNKSGAQISYEIAPRAKERRNWIKFCLLVMFIEQHKHWLGVSGEIDAWPWLVWFALTPRGFDRVRLFEVNTDAALKSCAFSSVLAKLTTTHRHPLANASSVARVNADKTEEFFDRLFLVPIAEWLGLVSGSGETGLLGTQQQHQQPLVGSAEYAAANTQKQQWRPYGSAPVSDEPVATVPSSFTVTQTRVFHLARTLLSVKRRFRVRDENCGDPATLAMKLVNKVDPSGQQFLDTNRLRRGARCTCERSRYERLPASDDRLKIWYERGARCPGTCSTNAPWRTQRGTCRYEHREKDPPRRKASELSGLRVPPAAVLARAAHVGSEPAMVLPISVWRALIKAEIRHHACDNQGSPVMVAATNLMDQPPIASATGLGSGVCFTDKCFPEFPLYETVDGSTVLFSSVVPVNNLPAQPDNTDGSATNDSMTDVDSTCASGGDGSSVNDVKDGNDGSGVSDHAVADNLDDMDLRICDIPTATVCLHETDHVPFDPRNFTEALAVRASDDPMLGGIRLILEAERVKMERYDIKRGSGGYPQQTTTG